MARQLDARLQDILQKYHPDPKSAVWDCHGVWVILHKAVEVIAAKAGVKFSAPTIIEADAEKKIVSLCVSGTLGDHEEWSIGEAAPYNNRNTYPYAMAEKRAKDRVVLKLIGLHGEIYSEDEADDFKPQDNKVSKQKETVPPDELIDQDSLYNLLLAEMNKFQTASELHVWGRENAKRIALLNKDEYEAISNEYSALKTKLPSKAA
jgi:hypothetical protein